MLVPRWIAESEAVLLARLSFTFDMSNGNDGRGSKPWKSNDERKKLQRILLALNDGAARDVFTRPVMVVVTRVLGPRQSKWDVDSTHRGTMKQLLDAMVAVGWFFDDSPQWITYTHVNQDGASRLDGPRIRVQIWSDVYEDVEVK
jgi:hypothetical protein